MLYDECASGSDKNFGPRDPRTIGALNLQGDFYTDNGDPATAAISDKRLLRLDDKTTSVRLAKCSEKQGK